MICREWAAFAALYMINLGEYMSIYDTLNNKQREAVLYTEGPLLILAGAGSGKTKAITHRIAYLIEEKQVKPYNIMAITFTNKAAAEMRQRVDKLVSHGCEQVWVATFHSSCVKILRRYIDHIGYDNSFTIYDTDDQKTLLKKIFKDLNINTKQFKEKSAMNTISSCKDKLVTPDMYAKQASGYYEETIAKIYREYQSRLKKNNALDFDDLIVKTVELFEGDKNVLEAYQDRFRYIMVDEYQDTNNAQFRLVELLAAKYKNLCVVGDDDQSIYKFRGANIENILNFEQAFPGAKVIKLEQNYRSTPNILDVANEVIKKNSGRKDKSLWTANDSGELVSLYQYSDAPEEAEAVVKDIIKKAISKNYNDFAILYRTNAQSRLIEERCVALGVPYQLIGGVNFYQRKEIKDMLAYLKVIASTRDDLALARIINVPKRGIGQTSIDKLTAYALANDISLSEACHIADQLDGLGRSAAKIMEFISSIDIYKRQILKREKTIAQIIEDILEETGYKNELLEEGEVEAETRLENIEELINKATSFEVEYDSVGEDDGDILSAFLEEVALVADIDRFDENESKVTLMTLHGAKGLEFDNVYMVGMEDGLFPSYMSINSIDDTDVEEERRLCYVGITRAKKHLTLTCARCRMVNGEMRWSTVSRFIKDLSPRLLDKHVLDSESYARKRENPITDGLPWNDNIMNSARKKLSKAPLNNTIPFGKPVTLVKLDSLDYAQGDMVRHIKFGEGKVLEINDVGKDFEVKVDFGEKGIKKLLAGFAKLQKL